MCYLSLQKTPRNYSRRFFGGSLKPSLLILDNLLILVFGDCGIYFYPQVCSKQVPNDSFLCFATESNRHSPPPL